MKKFIQISLIVILSLVLLTGAFSGGFIVGHLMPASARANSPLSTLPLPGVTTTPPPDTGGTPEELQTLFAPFWAAWDIIHTQYVNQPVDDVALMRGAIRGMLETLEFGRNYYQTPEEYKTAQEYLNRRDYTGIGAWVSTDKDYLTIISPIKGSPAEKAGLRPNDQIIAIDGEDMTGVEPEAARQKVLGPAGTNVTLTILRTGQEPFDVTITRAQIVVPLVEYEMLDGNIAYINLTTFGDTASEDLRAALTELLAQNPKGLILDLRNNGGGYLDQAVSVVSEFIPGKQVVVIEKYGDGSEETSSSTGRGLATDIPLVVLVNEGSASASEIVAGAIQDYGRAKLVGVTTFGKGSVQILTPLGEDQGVVGITIAAWLTPNGRTIEGTGLTPDVIVERTNADYDAGRDPQLEKAIELLKK